MKGAIALRHCRDGAERTCGFEGPAREMRHTAHGRADPRMDTCCSPVGDYVMEPPSVSNGARHDHLMEPPGAPSTVNGNGSQLLLCDARSRSSMSAAADRPLRRDVASLVEDDQLRAVAVKVDPSEHRG